MRGLSLGPSSAWHCRSHAYRYSAPHVLTQAAVLAFWKKNGNRPIMPSFDSVGPLHLQHLLISHRIRTLSTVHGLSVPAQPGRH